MLSQAAFKLAPACIVSKRFLRQLAWQAKGNLSRGLKASPQFLQGQQVIELCILALLLNGSALHFIHPLFKSCFPGVLRHGT